MAKKEEMKISKRYRQLLKATLQYILTIGVALIATMIYNYFAKEDFSLLYQGLIMSATFGLWYLVDLGEFFFPENTEDPTH